MTSDETRAGKIEGGKVKIKQFAFRLCVVFTSLVLGWSFPAASDPPAGPPVCSVTLDPVFCLSITDVAQDPVDSNKFLVEFEIVNWTGADAAGIVLTQNVGGGLAPGSPFASDAFIDPNGRPLGPLSIPPAGNLGTPNDWTFVGLSAGVGLANTRIDFGAGAGTPTPHPTFVGLSGGFPHTFDGLLDPTFGAPTTLLECVQALADGGVDGVPPGMIPGSEGDATPPTGSVTVPDIETVDDGPNVLDGFVIEIDDWDAQEQISFNWFLIDAAGGNIGIVSAGGAVMGDEYGFGSFNLARINSPAPAPIFSLNSGYDPPDDSDPNQDSPQFWREDQVAGVDTHPVNPIPAGEPGQGKYFAVEYGVAVTGTFLNPVDNSFEFPAGVPVTSGTNLQLLEVLPALSDWGIATVVFGMLIVGAIAATRRLQKNA